MSAPDLTLARAGTDYFVELLDALDDAQLAEPSSLPGWSRAQLLAHVTANAHGLGRLLEWARTGVVQYMYESREQRDAEIDELAALPPAELRARFAESLAHMESRWAGMPDSAWSAAVKSGSGKTIPASDTVWFRAREMWLHSFDLDAAASASRVPAAFTDRMLPEVVELWESRGDEVAALTLRPSDRVGVEFSAGSGAEPLVLSGTAAALMLWSVGRAAPELGSSSGEIPVAPRWI